MGLSVAAALTKHSSRCMVQVQHTLIALIDDCQQCM